MGMIRVALLTAGFLSTVGCRHGGAGYSHEYHRVTLAQGADDPDLGTTRTTVATSYGRHRVKLIDLSGVGFAILGTAASVRLEDPTCPPPSQGCTPKPVVDLGNGYYEYSYTARAVPIMPGIRFTLEYGWGGGEPDVTFDDGTTDTGDLSYSEYRMTLGVQERRDRTYFDFTLLDFTKRDLRVATTRATWIADPFQWRLGAEVGRILSPTLRAGVYLDYDMVAAIDWIFDGHAQGYNVGLAASLVSHPFILEGRVQREQLGSQAGSATGHGFVLSASLVY